MAKEGRRIFFLVLFIILVLTGLIASGYYIYFFSHKCTDSSCFENAIVNCKRASYINENQESITDYKIYGKSNGKCKIKVEMLQIKSGAAELEQLEGKSMICYQELGVMGLPEKNLKNCGGSLKEAIQEIIIKRMHSQIIENIGKVSEEVVKVL